MPANPQDPILFPPLPDDVFAAKLARWEKRGPKKRKPTNGYGRIFIDHDPVRFAKAIAHRKAAKTATATMYHEVLPGEKP